LAKILHTQPGLKIVQNERNGFVVCTLHYTADPRKRGSVWRAEAQQGLSQAKFEQEFEISYDAMLGEKVFPEIKNRHSEIVLKEGPYIYNQWPKDLVMWGGFDYGSRNPSSFHIYTIVDQICYVLWELYKPCKNIIEFAEDMKQCPFWDQIRYIACDPDIYTLKQRDMVTGGLTSVGQQLQQLGISKLTPGNTDEAAWLVQMQKHWCSPEITFKILECCPRMIEEFEAATYVGMSERQLETSDYREALTQKHNHALDDCKYFMNSMPNFKSRKIKLPNLAEQYGFWESGYPRQKVSSDKQWTFFR
jgi:hypothetical protein